MEVCYLDEWITLYNYTACCWFPTSSNILILPSQFWQIRFESCWLHCSKCRILVLLRYLAKCTNTDIHFCTFPFLSCQWPDRTVCRSTSPRENRKRQSAKWKMAAEASSGYTWHFRASLLPFLSPISSVATDTDQTVCFPHVTYSISVFLWRLGCTCSYGRY